MKNVIIRCAISLIVGVMLFGLWRGSMWLDSLMTVRTPLYYTIHDWASAIVCPIVGIGVGVLYDKWMDHF